MYNYCSIYCGWLYMVILGILAYWLLACLLKDSETAILAYATYWVSIWLLCHLAYTVSTKIGGVKK